MKNRNRMIEIVLITVAGLITIGLSIKNIVSNNKHEYELQIAKDKLIEKQDSIISLHKELELKQERIIQLQDKLNNKADIQISNLTRLNNPLPNFFYVSFSSALILTDVELEQIREIYHQRPNNGNLFPINVDKTNSSFDLINAFKIAMFNMKIEFIQDNNIMTISLQKAPMEFFGYNTSRNNYEVFMMYFEKEKKIIFDGHDLLTNNISSNLKSPSILDFENCDVNFYVSFEFPHLMSLINSDSQISYGVSGQRQMSLNFEKLNLHCNNYGIEVTEIKRIGANKFSGKWKKK